MQIRNRAIRLFVSSTFSDMHEERDALCRFVFPYIEDFCSHKNIGFTGIDLRWGVTEEEVRQGKTIGLCLSEIDNCRPYFLGILGERYGWIPEKKLTTGYEELFREKVSITEAEIKYGALGNQNEQSTKAFFCLRHPELTRQLTGGAAESPKNRKRLHQLKEEIRESPYPVLDGYTSIHAFCDFIKQQICDAIEKDFPKDETLNEYKSESIAHAYYAAHQNNIFTGRSKELSDIDQYMQTENTPLFVTGTAGVGKTAFLAHWAIRRQETLPDDFIFMHFYGASLFSDRWENVIKRLIYELCQKFEFEFKLPDTPGELMNVLSEYLYSASKKGKEVILVFDGVDCVNTDKTFGLAWLPKDLPTGVKMLLSIKTTEGRKNMLRRNYKEYRLAMLKPAEQKALLASHIAPYSKKLDNRHIERILQAKAAQNPLYLGVLLHELLTRSTHDRMDHLLDNYLKADNAAELFAKVINFYAETYDADITRNALSLISGAKHGLTENELLAMLHVPQASWSPLYLALKPFLVNKNGILNFAYSALREAVKQHYLPGKQAQNTIRRRLTEIFETKQTFHALEELAWLLEKTKAWSKLYYVLCDVNKFSQLWKHHPAEVKIYWQKIESNTKKRRIMVYEQISKHLRHIPKNAIFDFATFLFETGRPNEAEKLLLYLSNSRASRKNHTIRQHTFGLLGNLYYASGRYRDAKNYYQKKMAICQKDGNALEVARVLGNLGVIENANKNYEKALSYYEQAGDIFRKFGFIYGIQADLGNRGNIYMEMGQLDKAYDLFKKQEQVCLESGYIAGRITALGNQSVILMQEEKYQEALSVFDEQDKLCNKIGDLNRLQTMYGNRAKVLYELGEKKDALHWLQQKLALCEQINNFDGQQLALGNLFVYYFDENLLEKALDYCHQRMDLCRNHKARIPMADSLYQYAQILKKIGRNSEAEIVLRQIQILI